MFNIEKIVTDWLVRTKKANIRQNLLAKRSGVDAKTISFLFSFQSQNPTILTLKKIGSAISALEAERS